MNKRKSRIIIDTNLWISFLLTNNLSKLDSLLTDKPVTLIFSDELIDEIIDVATRPKFKKYFTVADLQNLLQTINLVGISIFVTSDIQLCRDPEDNFLLALAKDGKATHLFWQCTDK